MNTQNIVTSTNAKHFGQKASPKIKFSAAPSEETPVDKKKPEEPPTKEANSKSGIARSELENNLTASRAVRETSFRLDAPAAGEVLLAGDFTGWEKSPIKMIKGGGGTWHAKVALPTGRHSYRFLVDGNWQDDPNRQHSVPNPFGSTNSVVEIS